MARKCMETLNVTAEQLETMASATTFDEDSACFMGCFLVATEFVSQHFYIIIYHNIYQCILKCVTIKFVID